MARYEVASDFREVERVAVSAHAIGEGAEGDEVRVYVVREVADLRDTRGGHVYAQGAYRVRIIRPRAITQVIARARTFKGETAWSHAENYSRECVTAANRALVAHESEEN